MGDWRWACDEGNVTPEALENALNRIAGPVILTLNAADLIDRCCDYCRQLVQGIGNLSGAKIVFSPIMNQGLVRFEKAGASDGFNDVFTDEIIQKINATGEAFFSGTTWRGQRAMRISVVNWRTNQQDITRAIAALSSLKIA